MYSVEFYILLIYSYFIFMVWFLHILT